jgi:hypothetical protein
MRLCIIIRVRGEVLKAILILLIWILIIILIAISWELGALVLDFWPLL